MPSLGSMLFIASRSGPEPGPGPTTCAAAAGLFVLGGGGLSAGGPLRKGPALPYGKYAVPFGRYVRRTVRIGQGPVAPGPAPLARVSARARGPMYIYIYIYLYSTHVYINMLMYIELYMCLYVLNICNAFLYQHVYIYIIYIYIYQFMYVYIYIAYFLLPVSCLGRKMWQAKRNKGKTSTRFAVARATTTAVCSEVPRTHLAKTL